MDPAWEADLSRLAPRSDTQGWLKLHWFAGWEYEPIQRWRIFEMYPRLDIIPEELLADCKGLSPRDSSKGKWIEDGKRWVSYSTVDYDQWSLFQETGCFAVPVWIIQGTKGGNVWRLSQAEIGYLESTGITAAQLPLPGSLPYADYNQLTFNQLMARDRIDRMAPNAGDMSKNEAGLWVRTERKAEEEAYNAALSKWLDDQMEQAVDAINMVNLPGMSDLPAGDRHYNADQDEVEREFIQDTATTLEV